MRRFLAGSRRALVVWLLLAAGVGGAQASSVSVGLPEAPSRLEVEEGKPHTWRLTLAAGDLFHLRLEQLDVDVAIELLDSGGEPLRRDDAIRQPNGHEELWWVAKSAGEFQLRLAAAGVGTVLFKSIERRPASDADRRRTQAEHLLAAGRASARGKQEDLEDGLRDLEAARWLFSDLEIEARVCRCQRFESQLLRRLGRLDEAEARLAACAAIARAEGLDPERAAVWVDRSAIAHSRGDYAAALAAARKSLSIAEGAGLPSGIVDAQANVVLNLARLGRRREALEGQRALVTDARQRRDAKGLAYALVNLGANLFNLGDNARAFEALREGRDLLLELDLQRQAAVALSNLATVLATLGDYEAARAQNARALAIRTQLGDRAGQAASLVNVADVHRQLGQPDAAVGPYRRAIDLYVRVENRWGEGFAQAQLGAVLTELGRFGEAKNPLLQALEMSRELKHRDTEAEALASLARIAEQRGDRSGARRLLEEMVAAASQRSDPYREAEGHYRLALLAAEGGRRDVALGEIERAVDLVESVRARAGGERLRASFLHLFRGYYDLWIDLLLSAPTEGDQARAFAVAERAKARGLLDLLAETRGGVRLALSGDAVDEVLRLEGDIRGLQGRWRQAEGEDAAMLRRELDSALGELELARQALRRAHPRYAEVFEPEPLDLESTVALLDAGSLLLEYHTGGERSWLFAVSRRDGLSVHELPGEAELGEHVDGLRRLISRPGRRSEARFRAAAGGLWQLLLEPVMASLEDRSRVVVVADGPLRTLPFEVLVDPREPAASSYVDMPFLVRAAEVAYAPSASVLASLARLRSDDRRWPVDFVAYADPVPASPDRVARVRSFESADLGRLIGSAREAGAIGDLFPAARRRVYTGETAIESRLKSDPDLGKARYLHFATHGLVDPLVPARSALLLSSADDSEDGLLQAFEIVGLELSAELVTLSACETGLGRLYRGEGLLGLARAFVYAGADRLLASLWRVSDASTRELMTAFYSELRQDSSSPAAALRRAKLQLIERPDRAHPHAWAAFVLLGE